MKHGIATFTLDSGQCPPWLFQRMVKLGREITRVIIEEYGPCEFIKRIADPVWFQAFGTILAFDWNASGLTTTLTAALKEAIRGQEKDLGVFICGGKGRTSRKTPEQIAKWGRYIDLSQKSVSNLVYSSRISAKVDSCLVQDGYQLYHHSFFFSKNGAWAVVQQGMNTIYKTARRYHWYSEKIEDIVNEPHTGIATQNVHPYILNLSASESTNNRKISSDLVKQNFTALEKDIRIMRKHATAISKVLAFKHKDEEYVFMKLARREFYHNPVEYENFWNSKYLEKILKRICKNRPKTYEALLAQKGVGPKTIRALALISELIYGAEPSYCDPARYSFAHGGKDHIPYPVERETYDQSIELLRKAIQKSRLNNFEKNKILNKLRKSPY